MAPNAPEQAENVIVPNQEEGVVATSTSVSLTPAQLSREDLVRYKLNSEDDWIRAKLIDRAGKRGGKNENWWNVKNLSTGHRYSVDTGNAQLIERLDEDTPENDEEVYITTIPRYLHAEKRCRDAKARELRSWDDFQVYEEVEDEGQFKLGTNWVLTEKIINGENGVKARLTVRGDQEDASGVRKDSPTVRKGNIKIFSTIAAKEKWEIKSSDVTCAFLQGVDIERDVFLLPPKERRVPGMLWKLLKPVYGLVDAPRGWHLSLDQELTGAGCEKSLLDPAMYLNFSMSMGERKIEGMALTHVDDVLHGGSNKFEEQIMKPVKKAFKFGTEETEKFRYVGMNMTQKGDGIHIDQDHYIEALELPDMDVAKGFKAEEVLNEEGQTEFRSCVAKVLHVGFQSRPDVCFEAKSLSTKFGKATKSDLKSALKKIQKLKGQKTEMFFPNLGDVEDWYLVGYGDAGVRSMPDKINSVGGQVILLVNPKKNKACVLNWRSKKLVRKVISSLAGEALATVATIGEMVYNKSILRQIFGKKVDEIPVIVFTDSKNLHESIHSTSMVEDAWLIPDIAIIKEAIEQGTVTSIRRVSSGEMLANCLTKQGASAEQLLDVLKTGEFYLPRGLE